MIDYAQLYEVSCYLTLYTTLATLVFPPVSMAVTAKVCSPLVEVSTLPVHANPLPVWEHPVWVPGFCVQLAAVK